MGGGAALGEAVPTGAVRGLGCCVGCGVGCRAGGDALSGAGPAMGGPPPPGSHHFGGSGSPTTVTETVG